MNHFNKEAATWDDPKKVKMMAILAEATKKAIALDGPVDILDYGCGTGLYGLEFSEMARTLTGVDTSEGMLEVFEKKSAGADHIKSILLDLEKESLDQEFDLIVTSLTLHHLQDPSKMVGTFKSMLRDEGTIAIVDLDKEDGSFHPDNEGMGVKHFGFSKEEVEGWATANGLSLDYSIAFEMDREGKLFRIFLALFTR